MRDSRGFFGKHPYWAKITRNGQQWPKNMVAGLFKKITSSGLSGICVKWKFLWFIKNIFWSYIQKCLSANEISLFFNCQYFINRVISEFNFWDVDRHEWKKQGSLTGFLKKILIWGKRPFWAQKLRILITLYLLEEFF